MSIYLSHRKFSSYQQMKGNYFKKDTACLIGDSSVPLNELVKENVNRYSDEGDFDVPNQVLCVNIAMYYKSDEPENIEKWKIKSILWLIDTFRLSNVIHVGYHKNETENEHVLDAYITIIGKRGQLGLSRFESRSSSWYDDYVRYMTDPIYYNTQRIEQHLQQIALLQNPMRIPEKVDVLKTELVDAESKLQNLETDSQQLIDKLRQAIDEASGISSFA